MPRDEPCDPDDGPSELDLVYANLWKATAEIERLRAALEPFQRNAEAASLSEALGHIEREHLLNARKALGR